MLIQRLRFHAAILPRGMYTGHRAFTSKAWRSAKLPSFPAPSLPPPPQPARRIYKEHFVPLMVLLAKSEN